MLDITSIGALACRIQASVLHIQDAVSDLGIEPAARINGIVHFSERDCIRIKSHIEDGHAGFDDLKEQAKKNQ